MISRYTRPEMGRIWESENRYAKWLEVEVAACEAMAEEGFIPQKAFENIRKKSSFSVDRILVIEEETKHDIIAFLTNVAEHVGPDSRYIHLGLTSSDILDTSFALLLKEAMDFIIQDVREFMEVIKKRAFEHKFTVMIGRSHGIHAEPITFGLKLAVWYSEMKRNLRRLEAAYDVISYGKLSGAVGTFANVSPKVESLVCKKLGLNPAEISTQILQRDRHAEYFASLAIVAGTLEKIAVEISSTILFDEDKNPVGFQGTTRDITDRKRMEKELEQSFTSLRKGLNATINVLVGAVEVRDPYTAGHQNRVADLARAIATEMGLPKEKIEGIRVAGAIHDIGKISVPSEILSKPGLLNDSEFGLIKSHSQVGYDLLKNIDFPWSVARIVLQHHERIDGSGYPQGLSGEQICLEARIMGVADVVEAMSSHRPYRPALGTEKALEEISQNKGILYDPEVVDACVRLFTEKGFELV